MGCCVLVGACDPKLPYETIEMEPSVGAMLPCNVIVDGGVEVNAINPLASIQAIDYLKLRAVAGQVRDLSSEAVASLRLVRLARAPKYKRTHCLRTAQGCFSAAAMLARNSSGRMSIACAIAARSCRAACN